MTRLGTWFGAAVAALALGALTPACGGGKGSTGTATSGTHAGGGMTTSSSASGTGTGGAGTGGMTSSASGSGTGGTGGAGTGGMTSSSSSSSTSGTGGGASGGHGPEATQLVNAGEVCTSPGYKMVFTLGQPTQNQSKTTSPGYRMQGGLLGANGTLP